MSFNVGNNNANYLSTASVVASYPFAVHVRAKKDTSPSGQILWASQADANNGVGMYTTSERKIFFLARASGSTTSFETTTTYTHGVWFSALIVGISATERYVYVDGGGEGSSTVSRAIAAYTSSQIAKFLSFDPNTTFNGEIGDVCVWKDFAGNPFTLSVRQSLSLGISPLLLTSLVPNIASYVPLFNDSQGLIGPDYTENGTVVWSPAHPTVYFPRTAFIKSTPPAQRVAEDTLLLSEIIATEFGFIRSVSDTIALNETAARSASEDDSIALDEEIVLHHGRTVEDTIGLTETINLSFNIHVTDTIVLVDDPDIVVHVTDTIGLDDEAKKVYTVSDEITITETVFNDHIVSVTDTITLTDRAQSEPTPNDAIGLAETTTTAWSGTREGEDEIALFETVSYILNADCPTCCDNDEQYHPFVGVTSNPSLPTPPSETAPALIQSHTIVLSHPFDTPSLTLTLRAPQFGNQDTVSNQRIHRESRGGTLIIYADPQWPKVHRLVMEFVALSETKAQEYLDFRAATLGLEIQLVDHESRAWRGVLVETDTPIVRNRRHGLTASLTFEGELV